MNTAVCAERRQIGSTEQKLDTEFERGNDVVVSLSCPGTPLLVLLVYVQCQRSCFNVGPKKNSCGESLNVNVTVSHNYGKIGS